jgi:glycosyltransferase involved in cell wall biosynthesis
VITELEIGGAERCLTELAARLDRARFAPVVYSLAPPPDQPERSCVPRLEEAGVEVRFLHLRRFSQLWQATRRFRRFLADDPPELIQSFLFHANLLSRWAGPKEKVSKILSGVRVAEHAARWHLRLDRLTRASVTRYICVSEAVARFTHQRCRVPMERIVVIPNGIDTRQYPAAQPADFEKHGLSPNTRNIACIGRLTHQKGIDRLLETAPKWLPRHPDWRLLIVGDGPERDQLAAIAERNGITGQVRFLGWREDVPEILAASELLVLPSRWEGMPNVVLQAMASGLPVLATRVEGVIELLGEEIERQSVLFGETESWIEKIEPMLRSDEFRRRLGHENRQRVLDQFTLEAMVHRYEDLWESLLEEKETASEPDDRAR